MARRRRRRPEHSHAPILCIAALSIRALQRQQRTFENVGMVGVLRSSEMQVMQQSDADVASEMAGLNPEKGASKNKILEVTYKLPPPVRPSVLSPSFYRLMMIMIKITNLS